MQICLGTVATSCCDLFLFYSLILQAQNTGPYLWKNPSTAFVPIFFFLNMLRKFEKNRNNLIYKNPVFFCCVIWKKRNHLTSYIRLWINLFITFTGRFVAIQCLIYSDNMSEKYCLSYLPTCCNVNSLFFRHIVRLY